LSIFKTVFIVGTIILIIGVIIAVVPFKEEMVTSEYTAQISDWTVSWYYIPIEPTKDGFTGSFLENSTFPPVFEVDLGIGGLFGEWLYSTFGFIARADMEVPVDGYIKFEIMSGDGARLYIDGELIIDIWETRWDLQEVGSGSKVVEVSAGKHRLELWWYQWRGWAIAAFNTDRKIMVFEKKAEPILGLGVACLGVALIAIARIKTSRSSTSRM